MDGHVISLFNVQTNFVNFKSSTKFKAVSGNLYL